MDTFREAAREQDDEPANHNRDHSNLTKDDQRYVVRNCQEPLDQRQPSVELLGIRVVEVHVNALRLVGRWVDVGQKTHVSREPGRKSLHFEVEIKPPSRILLTEQKHQNDRHEDDIGAES